jgi:hypothetical protein
MGWRVGESLGPTSSTGLLGEINASAPARSKASDGSIGDEAHSSTSSDHNPCDCHAVVAARDFTHDPAGGFDAGAFARWLAGRVVTCEPRVKYIISNREICSGQGQDYPAGVWRPYTGSNPHEHHCHVSVRHGAEYFDDPRPWEWSADAPSTPVPPPPALADPALPVPGAFPAPPPPYPLLAGHYYGPESSADECHSGFLVADRPWVRYVALVLKARGWSFVEDSDHYTTPLAVQVKSFQVQRGLGVDGLVGPETFGALHA